MTKGTAWMRNAVTGDIVPLELIDISGPLATIYVPAFGHVMIAELKSNEPIVRLGPPAYRALLAQGADKGERELSVRQVDDLLEVELLPNVSKEDRLVVTYSFKNEDERVNV